MAFEKPYHDGELAVQARAGVLREARALGRLQDERIRPAAMAFVAAQAMAVLGSVDAEGNVWASVLFGAPGFLRADDDRTVHLARADCRCAVGDRLWDNLETHANVGLLLIDLSTRRRLRINGHIRHAGGASYRIAVARAYPNCPKYIQRRRLQVAGPVDRGAVCAIQQGERLDGARQAWIESADTFFVASAHRDQGVDASHRGGPPGFVQVLSPCRLRVPDYSGNNMFNTLGNFASYPHAGLVFIDFERGKALQLIGKPELRWDLTDAAGETGGTARYWDFEVRHWRESALPVALQWAFVEASPFLPVPNARANGNAGGRLNWTTGPAWDGRAASVLNRRLVWRQHPGAAQAARWVTKSPTRLGCANILGHVALYGGTVCSSVCAG